MNVDILEGRLRQLGGRLQEKWGKLRNDERCVADGHCLIVYGRMQEKYGRAQDAGLAKKREFDRAE